MLRCHNLKLIQHYQHCRFAIDAINYNTGNIRILDKQINPSTSKVNERGKQGHMLIRKGIRALLLNPFKSKSHAPASWKLNKRLRILSSSLPREDMFHICAASNITHLYAPPFPLPPPRLYLSASCGCRLELTWAMSVWSELESSRRGHANSVISEWFSPLLWCNKDTSVLFTIITMATLMLTW